MFDVIILDLNMPIMDGYEACKKINQMYDETKLL
jgi:CheY-like chemotaxis protein